MYFIIKSVRDSGSLWGACHLQSVQSSLHIPTALDGQSLVLRGHLLKCSLPCAIKKLHHLNPVLKTWLRVFIILMSCTAYAKYQLQILKLCFYLTLIIEPSTDAKSRIYFNADVSGLSIPPNSLLPSPRPWHSFPLLIRALPEKRSCETSEMGALKAVCSPRQLSSVCQQLAARPALALTPALPAWAHGAPKAPKAPKAELPAHTEFPAHLPHPSAVLLSPVSSFPFSPWPKANGVMWSPGGCLLMGWVSSHGIPEWVGLKRP